MITYPQPLQATGNHLLPGYARATDLRVYKPEYHHVSQNLMVKAYQQEQIALFRRIMDYEHVRDWAKTTSHTIVGVVGRKGNHPLQRYLNEVFPACGGWHARWDIFSSAADVFKGFPHLPRTTNISLCTNISVQPTGVSFTLYCPLPTWTQGLQAQLNELPFGSKIFREAFLTLLRARV